ncbi:MAG: ribonuclease activity regulator RraA [Ectothiorhodospiraceae bacterium]|nr:ribonuclease activity regulator RraA [Ectothiorhodospiraceae bacterium]
MPTQVQLERGPLDPAVIDRLRTVSTATLNMVMLKRGVRSTWMQGVRPLHPDAPRVAGEAFTVRFVPGREDLATPESYAASPSFRDAIDGCPSGQAMVIDACGCTAAATLGDILVARLAYKGVVAAVSDAPVRDVTEVRRVGLPVFCSGAAAPPSITGLVFAGYGELIGCGGILVAPGDVVVGDADGVVVVPRAMAAEVAEAGVEQERFERFVQLEVKRGAEVVGLYPPAEPALAAYRRWVEAGEPG